MLKRKLRNELSGIAALLGLGFFLTNKKGVASALALICILLRCLPTSRLSLDRKSVVITGGSRGLGLAIALQVAGRGALLTLLARDEEELESARSRIYRAYPSAKILTVVCDVTIPMQLADAFNQVDRQFGGIDVLVNNAGTIAVGPFSTMEREDYQSLLNLQVHAVVDAVQKVLPYFKRAGGGRIVNIASIAGKLAVPHMSSYCAAKAAIANLSEGLNAELAVDNIHVTTVYPGLMRTGSPIQAVFKGNHQKEYAWFTAGDVLPGLSVSATKAARLITDAVQNGSATLRFPKTTPIAICVSALFPELFATLMQTVARRMPIGHSVTRKTGAESRGWLEAQWWYFPLKMIDFNARKTMNQTEKYNASFNLGLN